jgi:alpha-beta hydrolase superfamily lysophospholipase
VLHALLVVAVSLTLLYVGLVALLWRFQEHIVFQPPAFAEHADVAARRVEYRAEDGVQLFGYVVGDCRANAPVVLAFHGNADLSRWLVPWAAQVARETNACVMIPEYRGYDGVAAPPTYIGSSRDARAALSFAIDSLNASSHHLVYFGHSLGSAIAAELAASHPPAALVLQAPLSSARAMSRRLAVPWVTAFWRLISRVHYDTVACVRSLDAPVWVAHGDSDQVIPVSMGREVFAAARIRGELLIVSGADHNNVEEMGGRAYWQWLTRAVLGHQTDAASLAVRGETRSAP